VDKVYLELQVALELQVSRVFRVLVACKVQLVVRERPALLALLELLEILE
jgi:hypothetical protein